MTGGGGRICSVTGGAGGRGGSDGQLYAGRPGFHPGLATMALALSMPQAPRQQRATCVSSGIGANRPRGQCESILSGEEETRVSVGGDGGSESLRGWWVSMLPRGRQQCGAARGSVGVGVGVCAGDGEADSSQVRSCQPGPGRRPLGHRHSRDHGGPGRKALDGD